MNNPNSYKIEIVNKATGSKVCTVTAIARLTTIESIAKALKPTGLSITDCSFVAVAGPIRVSISDLSQIGGLC